MDDDSLRNWGYYEPPIKNLGLQLMSPVVERDTKPFLSNREHPVMVPSSNGPYHQTRDCIVTTEPPMTHMDYVRDSWINHREKFHHMFPGNNNLFNPVLAESSGQHQAIQMVHHNPQPDPIKENRPIPDKPIDVKKETIAGPSKKRGPTNPKTPKGKKPRKGSASKENGNNNSGGQRAKMAKKNVEIVINGLDMDITGIPIPVCSCTGTPQQCYRWGCGGWQSACCTTTISMYPLPMSTKRRGARIAGRKMSQGAFKKVLEKLATEGYDLANPIDLRTYWAKHGTNKFVIIR
ncbi:GAGA binding protein-like [Castilleja foliolosa]|uniref:GAGA-binding transcriptional activator n=1 Tax=Castilleja foliolosa TaxID=1961234 RepID=A0ABD3EIL8_9LAMI